MAHEPGDTPPEDLADIVAFELFRELGAMDVYDRAIEETNEGRDE